MELSGAPKTVMNVSDQSTIIDTPISGIVCVQGITRRGKPGEPVFVGNSTQFKRKLGGLHPISKDPLLFMRLLDSGTQLWINRLAHYTDVTDKSTATGTKATGTLTVGANATTWTAEAVGDGYNGSTITIGDSGSGNAALADLIIRLADSDIDQRVPDVKRAMSVEEIDELNQILEGVNLTSITGTLPNGVVTLAAGAQDISLIVDTDYIGSKVGKTGWWSFGKVTDAFRIANVTRPVPAVDAELSFYVSQRMDMRFHIATPVGANADGMEDYRMGTGAYEHSPIDNWMGNLVAGAINITDPNNVKKRFDIPGLVDALPLIVKKDKNDGAWWSAAGPTRGKVLTPNNGLVYNLGDPDNAADFDRIYPKGINAIIKDESKSVLLWGNRSLALNKNSILSKENVADLIIYILRGLKPLIKVKQFDPNDPPFWKGIYRNVRPFITSLESGRAIRPGEGSMWHWVGDQDVDKAEDATYNSQADLDAGKFKARFIFVPIPATEYIGIDVTVSDSNSLQFNVSQLT